MGKEEQKRIRGSGPSIDALRGGTGPSASGGSVLACVVMASVGMADADGLCSYGLCMYGLYILMACVFIAYIVTAYIVMAYIVMAAGFVGFAGGSLPRRRHLAAVRHICVAASACTKPLRRQVSRCCA